MILLVLLSQNVQAMQDAGSGADVTITIHSRERALRDVLREISEATGLRFVYMDELVDPVVVSCDHRQTALTEVLRQLLHSNRIDFQLLPVGVVVLSRAELGIELGRQPVRAVDLQTRQHEATPPVLFSDMAVPYPSTALKFSWAGRVELQLLINAKGRVERVVVVKPSMYPILNRAAVSHCQVLRYIPATRAGKNVSAWTSYVVNYELR